MKILFLYAELMNYMLATLRCLSDLGHDIHVVHWDKKKLTSYQPQKYPNITFYSRSEIKDFNFLESFNFTVCYVSGWQDLGYLPVAFGLRRKKIPVVIGFDDQWIGSLKQKIGLISFRFFNFNSIFFSHAWVAGFKQYEYARKFGFKHENIIFDLLSCDSAIFKIEKGELLSKLSIFPKKFLYVGNFRMIKGFDVLLKAYRYYRNELKGSWTLDVFGMGELDYLKDDFLEVNFHSFVSQSSLVELSKNYGVFILPSRLDQWGVVVHEFASLGYPLLLSSNVGAKDYFLIEGFNGYTFLNNNFISLANKMLDFETMSIEELNVFAFNSIFLSKKVSSQSSAGNFLKIFSLK